MVCVVSSCALPGDKQGAKSRKNPNTKPDTSNLSQIEKTCVALVEDEPEHKIFTRPQLRKRFLDAHNKDRRLFGLPELVWDDSIARYAQSWADYLKTTNECKMVHRANAGRRDGKSYGENLAWNWTSERTANGVYRFSPEESVYGWNSECKDYNFEDTSCKPGKQCGHFTQSVWKSTKRVGCGVAVCDQGVDLHSRTGRSELWVCNYDPPGNVVMQMPSGKKVRQKPF